MNGATRVSESGGASSPSQLYELFERAIASNDVAALTALYEAEAVVVPQPGRLARGREEVRAALEGFAAAVSDFSVRATKEMIAGDVALVSGSWTATALGPDGSTIPIGGADAVVARRGPDGTWRMAIDDANFIA